MEQNYREYLNHMTESFGTTSKGILPQHIAALTRGIASPRILEVGFGSGVIGHAIHAQLPSAQIVGIDMVQENIDAQEGNGVYSELYCCRFEDFVSEEGFDVILFASVLHEIGSYNSETPYAFAPVRAALLQAHSLLRNGGSIVIRDGVAQERARRETIESYTLTEDAFAGFCRFAQDFEGAHPDFCSTPRVDYFDALRTVFCPRWMMQEFLMTWTWGSASYAREVRERVCYMSLGEYRTMLAEVGFTSFESVDAPEQYPEYFGRMTCDFHCPNIMAIMVARV